MSFAKGLTEDQLAELMMASARKENRAAAIRDGRPVPANPGKPGPKERRAKGLATRAKVLEALKQGPIQSSQIHVGVRLAQVKQILRFLREDGVADRVYVNRGRLRIALWSLTAKE